MRSSLKWSQKVRNSWMNHGKPKKNQKGSNMVCSGLVRSLLVCASWFRSLNPKYGVFYCLNFQGQRRSAQCWQISLWTPRPAPSLSRREGAQFWLISTVRSSTAHPAPDIILYIPSHPTLKFHGATSVYDICHLESQIFWSAKHWIHYISGLNNKYQMVNSKTGINLYE